MSASFEYLCYGFTAIINILFFQCGDRFQKSESDVYRRQILTSESDPRTKRVKIPPTFSQTDMSHSRLMYASAKAKSHQMIACTITVNSYCHFALYNRIVSPPPYDCRRLWLTFHTPFNCQRCVNFKFGTITLPTKIRRFISFESLVKENESHYPADPRRWTNVGLMLDQRLRRWTNIKPTSSCLMISGIWFWEVLIKIQQPLNCQRGVYFVPLWHILQHKTAVSKMLNNPIRYFSNVYAHIYLEILEYLEKKIRKTVWQNLQTILIDIVLNIDAIN